MFRWSASPGADRYELAVTDQCAQTGFRQCAFQSATVESTSATEFVWASDLAVSTAVPVGRRYFWRVRACTEDACSDWTFPRSFDAGPFRATTSTATDLATVSSPCPSVPVARHTSVCSPRRGWAVSRERRWTFRFPSWAYAGDADGDGFADLLVADPGADADAGLIELWSGQPTIADTSMIGDVTGDPDDRLGLAVHGIFDDNNDGFHDFVATDNAPMLQGARVFTPSPIAIFSGNARSEIDVASNSRPLAVGDLDGDGEADVVVGLPDHPNDGAILVYRSNGSSSPFSEESTPGTVPAGVGNVIHVADLDADGFCGARSHHRHRCDPRLGRGSWRATDNPDDDRHSGQHQRRPLGPPPRRPVPRADSG